MAAEPTPAQVAAAWVIGYLAETYGAGPVTLAGPDLSRFAFEQGREDRRQEQAQP
jgi:hypothetical protein